MVASMLSRTLSKDCNHSKAGVCSKCVLKETFNLDSLSEQVTSTNQANTNSHVVSHTETPVSTPVSTPILDVFNLNSQNECNNSPTYLPDSDPSLPLTQIPSTSRPMATKSEPSIETIEQKQRIEVEFVNSLIAIGNKLKVIQTRYEKSKRLICELYLLDLKLPARVWLPLYSDLTTHLVVRIPYAEGCVLNSKDRAPYCIYCEVIEVENVDTANVPEKSIDEQIEQLNLIKSISSPLTSNYLTVPSTNGHSMINGISDELVDREPQSRNDLTLNSCRSEPVLCAFDDEMASFNRIIDETRSVVDSDELYSQLSDEVEFTDKPLTGIAKIRQRLARLKRRKRPGLARSDDDPSASIMSEPWEEKQRRIKESSPYGNLPGWKLLPVIVKTGDDLRQELLAYQLLTTLQSIWQEEGIPIYLRPYKIVVCSYTSGMIEPIPNACSLHQIKKNLVSKPHLDDAGQIYLPTLLNHFLIHYGSRLSDSFQHAQQNFIRSCAAYSLACYYLQVKDRHNGNILLDSEGFLIHIDFGYILTISPRNLGFETSPFKLTSELIEVMGGLNSETFANFRELLFNGMLAVRKHHKRIMTLVDVISNNSLPCFRGGNNAVKLLLDRFHIGCSEDELRNVVNGLVDQSRDALTTQLYDRFQYYTNGIF